MVRCKFTCTNKEEANAGKPEDGYRITMHPVSSGSPENEAFFKYTPWGNFEFGTINKYAADQIEVGKEYYIDISPAPAPAE